MLLYVSQASQFKESSIINPKSIRVLFMHKQELKKKYKYSLDTMMY